MLSSRNSILRPRTGSQIVFSARFLVAGSLVNVDPEFAGQQCDRNSAENIIAMKSAAETSSSLHSATLRIREIVDADIDPVITLLTRGFPNPRHYWEVGFARLQTRSLPPNIPRYGYLLEADNNPVGVILLISSLRRIGNREELFSNLSSWYVEPDYRSHAAQLFKRALANKKTTFLNVSAATSRSAIH